MASNLVVVIATAGRAELLRRTLDSLLECRKPDNYRETIVVENGPRLGAEEVVRSFRSNLNTRYVYVSRANKSHALNKALETIGESLIFFTDDDVRFHHDTLCAYAEAAAGVQGGQFYGGPVGVDHEQEPARWLLNYLGSSGRSWRLDKGVEVIEKPVFLGCNWAAFAGDLRNTEGFDTTRGPGAATGAIGQEHNMQRQLLENGVQGRYIPEAMVWHYVPVERCSPRWALKRAYRYGVGLGLDSNPQAPLLAHLRWAIGPLRKLEFRTLVKSVRGAPWARFRVGYLLCISWGQFRGGWIARREKAR